MRGLKVVNAHWQNKKLVNICSVIMRELTGYCRLVKDLSTG